MTDDEAVAGAGREGTEEDWEPRCHHYEFAHIALRQCALGHPLETMAILTSGDCPRFLEELFHGVSEHCDAAGAVASFGPKDIKVHTGRVLDYPCVVIEMPPPERPAEAFYVALVLLMDLAKGSEDRRHPELRYFTLERGAVPPFGSPTVLCEWTSTAHANYGSGPTPVLRDFIEVLTEKLSERGGKGESAHL